MFQLVEGEVLLIDEAGVAMPVAHNAAVGSARGFIGVGYDGSNTQFIRVDSTGRQFVVGAAASGAAVAGNPVLVAGSDGTNARSVQTDTGGRVVTTEKAARSAVTAVSASDTVQTLKASNAARLGLVVFNNTDMNLYVKLGSSASLTDFSVKLERGQGYEMPYGYTGIVTGIWDAAGSGDAMVTELT